MQILNSSEFHNPQRFVGSNAARRAQSVLSPSKNKQIQDGFQIFQASLSKSYQKFSTQTVVPVAATQKQRLSAETVANNILGFIEQRLRKDEASGASAEQLQERLNQGLEGFKKGFAEAKEKIEALALLSPEVEEDIGKTYDLVLAGVDDLRERFVEGVKQNDVSADVANTNKLNKASALSASFGQVSYSRVDSFSFEVETADGDVVSIRANSKDIYAAEYRAGSFANGSSVGAFEQFSSSSFQSSRFDLQVAGELDDDELRALDQLLGKVEDLSSDFFAGDLDSAFKQALNLGYDSNEIVGYSLNLRQVEVQRVAVAYQQVGAATPINPLADRLQPLGNFARDLLNAVDRGSVFADPSRLIADLSEQIDLYQPPSDENAPSNHRFSNFVKDILDALPAQKVA
jgi:hypothetical protein